MKIIFLNVWNGKVQEGITEFIKEQSRDTDIFCFQEAYDEFKELFKDVFPNHKEFSAYKFVIKDDDFPQATYASKNINIISSEILFDGQIDCGLGIYLHVEFDNTPVHICNFHGLSKPGDKLDNPNRLSQSQKLIDFFKEKEGLKIIGGDFNLFPETKSVQMFEENGYRDLIKEFEISTTRNHFTWDMYPDNPQYYSDYVFVSPNVKIKGFLVPDIEISDHLPMILEIAI